MTLTVKEAIETFGIDLVSEFDFEEIIPVLSGLQFQGDVMIRPVADLEPATTPVPEEGVTAVQGETNTHLILHQPGVAFDYREEGLQVGVLTVPEGATAYMGHPEHGYAGIAPGNYSITRQREQKDEIELVRD